MRTPPFGSRPTTSHAKREWYPSRNLCAYSETWARPSSASGDPPAERVARAESGALSGRDPLWNCDLVFGPTARSILCFLVHLLDNESVVECGHSILECQRVRPLDVGDASALAECRRPRRSRGSRRPGACAPSLRLGPAVRRGTLVHCDIAPPSPGAAGRRGSHRNRLPASVGYGVLSPFPN